MTNPEQRHARLIAWLEDQGHSAEEIDKVLARVAEYDDEMLHDSVFDSIEAGKFDIGAIIDSALGDDVAVDEEPEN